MMGKYFDIDINNPSYCVKNSFGGLLTKITACIIYGPYINTIKMAVKYLNLRYLGKNNKCGWSFPKLKAGLKSVARWSGDGSLDMRS